VVTQKGAPLFSRTAAFIELEWFIAQSRVQ
jgi:hypothetical protein